MGPVNCTFNVELSGYLHDTHSPFPHQPQHPIAARYKNREGIDSHQLYKLYKLQKLYKEHFKLFDKTLAASKLIFSTSLVVNHLLFVHIMNCQLLIKVTYKIHDAICFKYIDYMVMEEGDSRDHKILMHNCFDLYCTL